MILDAQSKSMGTWPKHLISLFLLKMIAQYFSDILMYVDNKNGEVWE